MTGHPIIRCVHTRRDDLTPLFESSGPAKSVFGLTPVRIDAQKRATCHVEPGWRSGYGCVYGGGGGGVILVFRDG